MGELDRLGQALLVGRTQPGAANEFTGGPTLSAVISSVDLALQKVGVTLTGLDGVQYNTPTMFSTLGNYIPEIGHQVVILMLGQAPVVLPPAEPIVSAPPGAVSGLVVTGGIGALILRWNALVDANVKWNRGYYEVQIDTVNTFNSINLKTVQVAANSTVITGLTTGTTYYTRVRGVNYTGVVGGYSAIVSGVPIHVTAPDTSGLDFGVPSVSTLVGLTPSSYSPPQYVVYLTTDQKLYRWDGVSAWTKAVATGDLLGTIATAQIATDAITATLIAAGAVGSSELAASAVIAGKIAAGTIVAADIAALTITAAKIAANTITAAQIAASTITATQIAAATITGDRLVVGTITATQIASGTITATQIAAATILAGNIAAGTITSVQIAADTITAGNIAANAITTSELAANSVTAAKVTAIALEAGKYVRSTSYVAGVSGWDIEADGTAEFNNVIVRGRVIAASITSAQLTAVEGVQILPNGTFDANITGWTAGANTTIVRDTGTKRTGAGSLKLSPNTSFVDISATTPGGISGFVVEAGASYQARAWFRGSTILAAVKIVISWYTAGGALISTNSSNLPISTNPAWVSAIAIATAPSNAAFASIAVWGMQGTGGTDTYYVDDVFFAKSSKITGASFITASEGVRTEILDSGNIQFYTEREGALPGYIMANMFSGGVPINDSTLAGVLQIASPSSTNLATPRAILSLRSDSVNGAVPSSLDVAARRQRVFDTSGNYIGAPLVFLSATNAVEISAGNPLYLINGSYQVLDAANVSANFVAPPSGRVLIVFTGYASANAGTGNMTWTCDLSPSIAIASYRITKQILAFGNTGGGIFTARFYLDGLTAGAFYVARWAAQMTGTAQGSIYRGSLVGGLLIETYAIYS